MRWRLTPSLLGLLPLALGCGKTQDNDAEPLRDQAEAVECTPWHPEGAWSSLPTSRPALLNQIEGSQDGSIYAVGRWLERGTPRTDLFRSTDAGTSWCVIATPEQPSQVVVSPADAQVLYALSSLHVMRTADAGATWTVTSELPEQARAATLVASATAADTVWLNDSPSTLVSTDGAQHWSAIAPPPFGEETFLSTITVDLTSAERAFAVGFELGTEAVGRALATADGGATWQETFPPFAISSFDAFASASGVLYLAGEGMIIASKDWGSTWHLFGPLPTPQASLQHLGLEQGEFLYALDQTDTEPHLWLTAEGEVDWRAFALPDPKFLPLLATRERIIGEVDGRLETTVDAGQSWSLLPNVLKPTALSQSPVAPFPIWDSYLATVFSRDGGLTWNDGPQGQPIFDGRSADTVFLRTLEGLQRSEDGARTWSPVELPEAPVELQGAAACAPPDSCLYVMYRRASDTLTSDATRLARSDDQGRTWAEPLTLPEGDFYFPRAFAVLPDSPEHLLISGGWGMKQTHDGGFTWTELWDTTAVGNIVGFPDGTLLMARGTFGYPPDLVLRSTDSGLNWVPVPDGPGQLVQSHAKPDTLFMLSVPLLRSDDRGATWFPVTPEAWSNGSIRVLGVADAPDGGFVAAVQDFGLVGFE